MARNVTIAQLIARAKERADMESATFVDDTEWQKLIDVAYAELIDLLIEARIHQFETTATITTSAGTASYAVPADHYRTLGIDYRYDGTNYWEVPELMFGERNDYQTGGTLYAGYGGYGGGAAGWRLVGENIVLSPTPQAVQTYRHIYVPAPVDISAVSTSTNVNGVAGWEEYIVLHAARAARVKESDMESVAALDGLLGQMRARVEESGRERSTPRRIVDVHRGPYWSGTPGGGWWP